MAMTKQQANQMRVYQNFEKIFLIVFVFIITGCGASALSPVPPNLSQKDKPVEPWQIIAQDVVGQIELFLEGKKDLRIKPMCLDFPKNAPDGEKLYRHLKSTLARNGIPVVSNGQDALGLHYKVRLIDKTGSGDAPLMENLEFTTLDANLFVSRKIHPDIVQGLNANKTQPAKSTLHPSIQDQHFLLTLTLHYMNHQFLKQSDIYIIRDSQQPEMPQAENPSPQVSPSITPAPVAKTTSAPPKPEAESLSTAEPIPKIESRNTLNGAVWDVNQASAYPKTPTPTQPPMIAPPMQKGRTFHVVD